MKRFQNILCVVDPLAKEQFALERAFEIADRNRARLKLIDVVEAPSTWLGKLFKPHQDEIEQDRKTKLEFLARSLHGRQSDLTTEVVLGRPAVTVVREVLRNDFDLVMKDFHGQEGSQRLAISSTDMRLLRNCPCPVWLTKPRLEKEGAILAAIDPLAEGSEHKNMNQAILSLTSDVASMANREAHVVSAWNAKGEGMLAGRVAHERLQEYISETRQAAEQGLTQTLSQFRPRFDQQRIHFRNGEPAKIILDCARRIQCDLLIMGSVADVVPGLLMGNTADTVLRQTEHSIMMVKPHGFVSPLKPR